MNILGISCFYHDSSACLVCDGQIIAAVQEERFTRKKHDPSFPVNSINFCLNYAGIKISDVDYIAFYDKPFVKFERIVETHLAYAPRGIKSYLMAVPLWIREKLWTSDLISKEIGCGFRGEIIFLKHHQSHAASAFFPSPFKSSAFLTIDGVGEWSTTTFGIAKDNKIEIHSEIKFPHSLGLLYSAFTYYMGFRVNSGEYKLMGLASYGEPKYVDLIYEKLIDVKEDGSFKLNMEYFNYCVGLRMTNKKFNDLFLGNGRKPDEMITQKHMDIAASIQKVTEEIILRMAKYVKKVTQENNLCLAGGVALNCVANGKLLREKIFDEIWVQPASGDSGGALGAALFVWYQYLDNKRDVKSKRDSQKGSLLGPEYTDNEIKEFLDANKFPYKECESDEIMDIVSDLLIEQKVIGWFNGRMEYGPRALGARSILADARSENMQSVLNLKIKFRESFRPFAPSVLKDKASEYFDIETESPYMLFTAPVKKERCIVNCDKEDNLFGIDRLKIARSDIPAVTHVDCSSRVQTINEDVNPHFYRLIKKFYEKTGCAVLINTSFNVRGEPIVCTPQDAYKCFMRTDMDYLVLGNFILKKEEQPEIEKQKSKLEFFLPD